MVQRGHHPQGEYQIVTCGPQVTHVNVKLISLLVAARHGDKNKANQVAAFCLFQHGAQMVNTILTGCGRVRFSKWSYSGQFQPGCRFWRGCAFGGAFHAVSPFIGETFSSASVSLSSRSPGRMGSRFLSLLKKSMSGS